MAPEKAEADGGAKGGKGEGKGEAKSEAKSEARDQARDQAKDQAAWASDVESVRVVGSRPKVGGALEKSAAR